jgi:BirA family transcriptional regulator, biotin operon repressor / biotin---[acetyl-CoA-carboxylase] ligase
LKPEVLNTLINTDGFVSGESLGEAAGITRAALWKQIKALEKDGAVIEAVTGKGYRLKSPPETPRAEYVKAYIHTEADIFYRETTGSTNDDAKAAAQGGSINRAAFIAGEQKKGRGRKGRQWVSPPGGLYVSFFVRPNIEPARIPGLTIIAAVSVCSALENTAGVSPQIKWPNDIMLGGRKLAGILTECMIGMDGVEYAVCGIGINIGTGFAGELSERAASVEVNRTILAAAVLDSFFRAYDTFLDEGLPCFMDGFRKRSMLSGRITVAAENRNATGEFIGFDEEGALLLDCMGEEKRFIAGEVSVRGEKIYV